MVKYIVKQNGALSGKRGDLISDMLDSTWQKPGPSGFTDPETYLSPGNAIH